MVWAFSLIGIVVKGSGPDHFLIENFLKIASSPACMLVVLKIKYSPFSLQKIIRLFRNKARTDLDASALRVPKKKIPPLFSIVANCAAERLFPRP